MDVQTGLVKFSWNLVFQIINVLILVIPVAVGITAVVLAVRMILKRRREKEEWKGPEAE